MKNINRRLRDNNIQDVIFFDKPSKNGYPTKESLVLTALYKFTEVSNPYYINELLINVEVGFALKAPGDEHVPRFGKAIALKHMYQEEMEMEVCDSNAFGIELMEAFMETDKFNSLPPKIQKRFVNILVEKFYTLKR